MRNPSPASSLSLTSEEIEKIRALKAKAAIVMHYISGSDWSQAQIAGLKSQFDKMGVEVVAVTDAGFNPERQVANIQKVLALQILRLSSRSPLIRRYYGRGV